MDKMDKTTADGLRALTLYFDAMLMVAAYHETALEEVRTELAGADTVLAYGMLKVVDAEIERARAAAAKVKAEWARIRGPVDDDQGFRPNG